MTSGVYYVLVKKRVTFFKNLKKVTLFIVMIKCIYTGKAKI